MAESITIARPYAKAAFEAAKEKDALAAWSGMLAYAGAVAEDEEMKVVLDHPSLTSEQKTQLFTEVCGDKLDADAQRYIAILAENKRLALLSDIAELFEFFKSQLEQSVEVDIESAFELGNEEQDKLAQALSKKLDRKVLISASTNNELIGGAIIRAQDLVIDASVRGKIAKLAEAMSA